MNLIAIEKILREKQLSLLVLPRLNYSENVVKIVKILATLSNPICYVSANKPEKNLIEIFNANGIDSKKFVIIDCVDELPPKGKNDRTTFVRSPANLPVLKTAIKEAIEMGAENIFVDAISTFMIYEEGIVVVRFVHSIITMIRKMGKKCVLIFMEGTASKDLLDDLSMFVDSVYECILVDW